MAALLPLLLSCGAVLLFSVGAHENYDRLPANFKKGVDLALRRFNARENLQQHYFFFRSLLQSDIEPGNDVYYIYHHFILKATQCPNGHGNVTVDTQDCQFREDKPSVDCGMCYKTINGEIVPRPEPYILCEPLPTLTAAKKRARINRCNRMDDTGAPGTLAE